MFRQGHILNKLLGQYSTPLFMGILNVTPDSFSDGNNYLDLVNATKRAKELISEGADILDIGGESTRPQASTVDLKTEIDRVIPVIHKIREFSNITISVDTRKAEVAKLAIKAGADIINDISALRFDKQMIKVLSMNPEIGIILMHMIGEPDTMQINPDYDDVINEINDFFYERLQYCMNYNIDKSKIIIDPGIGFGKDLKHNLSIISGLSKFKYHNVPILLGASRKRFISELSKAEPQERLAGSLAVTDVCINADIDIIRVHDIKEHKQYAKVKKAIMDAEIL